MAGYDYTQLSPHVRTGPDGVHRFTRIARNRAEQLVAGAGTDQARQLLAGPLRVLLMDVPSGTVTTMEANDHGDLHEQTQHSFRPVSAANYEWTSPGRWVFHDEPSGVMSILDVYDLIKQIGRCEPHTLAEVSFMAHAWAGGPTLVNSDDRLDRDPAHESRADDPRDVCDKDGRRYKDFRHPTNGPQDLQLFRAAFCTGGYLWNWGCNNSLAAACVLHQAVRNNPSPLTTALNCAAPLTFTFDSQDQENYFWVDSRFFPQSPLAPDGSVTFQRSITETTAFLKGRIRATYNSHAAAAIGLTCYGALPGTSSDYERNGLYPQMEVPASPGYAENFTDELRFYERYLDARFDLEGRGFGQYTP